MRTTRRSDELRPIKVTPGFNRYAEGSALVEWGYTTVLATVTIDNRLPPHLRGQRAKSGWLTAEYALLPRSTQERSQRERLYAGGRTQEIQRLIGRALRSVVALEMFRNRTIIIDIDVLQADGGTRCAGITAGYAALHHAASRLVFDGTLSEWPLQHELAAVSVGVVQGETYVDLQYSEDVQAEVDLNVIATREGEVVEVQGGGEDRPIPAETYVTLVANGVTAVQRVLDIVRPQLP
ncbi:MAG: ribonuclease PH [Deinococcales bacterium]|jgi:ribonuclease PH